MKITKLHAREILGSNGLPTLEVSITLNNQYSADASVSYGLSAGSREATVIVDKDPSRFAGNGMLTAVRNVNEIIAKEIVGKDFANVRELDDKLLEMDGSPNKSKLGGNTLLGVSMAYTRAMANSKGIELHKYLSEYTESFLENSQDIPSPNMVIIEGGKHADNSTDFQEYALAWLNREIPIADRIRKCEEVYLEVKKILKRNKLNVNVGTEGAFAPAGIASNELPLQIITEAISNANLTPGVDCGIYIDVAASELVDESNHNSDGEYIYNLTLENKKLSSDELIAYYQDMASKYPIVMIEDPLHESDYNGWNDIQSKFDIPIVTDDFTVTNKSLLDMAIQNNSGKAILIKLNQIGTVSETIDTCLLAKEHGWQTIISHRGGGESNDTFMADLAVAVGSSHIKCGPTRGERVAKYNRLMRIAEDINY